MPRTIEIPGLGKVTKDEQFGWYVSEPRPIAALNGQVCRVILDDYDSDPNKEDFHVAIANFLSIDASVLKAAETDMVSYHDAHAADLKTPSEVWNRLRLGTEPTVKRRPYGDKGIYISVECGCDWEDEHGLEIVFKNGLKVNKLGPYDGHCTNSDAWDKDSLEDVVYY